MRNKYDLLVIGAGFFGLTVANLAAKSGYRVLVLEKRDHLGGNAHSYVDDETGIEVHKYGSHLFHTSSVEVWEFINQFSLFNNYKHKVFSKHDSQLFSLPVNLHTISQIFGRALSPNEARAEIKKDIRKYQINEKIGELDNFEGKAISAIGPTLYEAFFRGYTQKQWETHPSNLPSEVFSRLPVRFDLDSDYFNDTFQGLPLDGYYSIFRQMVSHENIEVLLQTDYFSDKPFWDSKGLTTVYTGPIDHFFDYRLGRLQWRTLDFRLERLNESDFQGTSVVNYPDLDVDFTRIHEFRHLHRERKAVDGQTLIAKEYSRWAERNDEPYYPVNSEEDRDLLARYRDLTQEQRANKIFFGGRLGRYQYLDMHMAIASAMRMFSNELKPILLEESR